MKNVSSLPNKKIDSPKTPGGISKSLLTPCRRVGLSRNWRKNGPSPFVSPLASSVEATPENTDIISSKKETRKRKERCDQEKYENLGTPKSNVINSHDCDLGTPVEDKCDDLESTPSRNVVNPRRKKSKILLQSLTENIEVVDLVASKECVGVEDDEIPVKCDESLKDDDNVNSTDSKTVTTPIGTKSKSKNIKLTIKIGGSRENKSKENIKNDETASHTLKSLDNITEKQKSPNNLTKECIVVIQKKIYKKDLEKLTKAKEKVKHKVSIENPVSQNLFDSDSDDIPLSIINNKDVQPETKLVTLDEDDDFEQSKKVTVKKLEDKTTSTGGLKSDSVKKKSKLKEILSSKSKDKNIAPIEPKPSQCNSFDDDEDFVMDKKRTILIRKSYDKVTKPLKAKSTGSITQKDIDELKARIEIKKKLLMAKAVTEDTEELRDLIKKWQRGCQDALMDLMTLMKQKLPDKQNMDYAEILQTLKIPASLVGYDEENDCFGTPTDENIILSKFNDT